MDLNFICVDTLKATEDALLLDVREPYELSDPALGQIDGVMNIPVGLLTHSLPKLADYKDKPVITICRSGARATTAAQILITGGFSDVKILDGGMLAYRS